MRSLKLAAASFLLAGAAMAEPFQEVTVGLPVANLAEAEAWYTTLLGPDVEVIRPAPGVTEFKVAPTVWLQLFEAGEGATPAVRFKAEDMAAAQAAHTSAGIDSGEAIEVPDVVTYSEFTDPFGNALGLYDVP